MNNIPAFDLQLGDVIWLISSGLRAGYSLQQVFAHLGDLEVEPTASVFMLLSEALQAGRSFDEAGKSGTKEWSSAYLVRLLTVMQTQREMGGNLADRLDPLRVEVLAAVGTDKALYPEMRETARQLKVVLPEGVLEG